MRKRRGENSLVRWSGEQRSFSLRRVCEDGHCLAAVHLKKVCMSKLLKLISPFDASSSVIVRLKTPCTVRGQEERRQEKDP